MLQVRLFRPDDDDGPLPDAPPVTVRDVVSAYLAFAATSYSPRALAERQRVLDQFCAVHGSKLLTEAKPSDLATWIASRKRWKSDWTRRAAVQIVQRPFNHAVTLGLIDKNPYKGFRWEEGEPRRPMTEVEFRALLRSTDSLFRRVLFFLRWSGCRAGELSAMRWPDVDFARGLVILQEHKSRKKTRKPRVIPLIPVLVRLLAWMRRQTNDQAGLVFTTSIGSAWTRGNMSWRFRRLRVKAGVAATCFIHGARHAFGSQGVLSGANLKLLSLALGHANVSTTERFYVHVDREYEAIRSAAELAAKGVTTHGGPP